jgi:hypothetical protein
MHQPDALEAASTSPKRRWQFGLRQMFWLQAAAAGYLAVFVIGYPESLITIVWTLPLSMAVLMACSVVWPGRNFFRPRPLTISGLAAYALLTAFFSCVSRRQEWPAHAQLARLAAAVPGLRRHLSAIPLR